MGKLRCDGLAFVVAVQAASRPRIWFPVDCRLGLDGEMIPFAAVLVSVGVSRDAEGDNRGWTSSTDRGGGFDSDSVVAAAEAADGGI